MEFVIHLFLFIFKSGLELTLLVFFHLDHGLFRFDMHTQQLSLIVEFLLLLFKQEHSLKHALD